MAPYTAARESLEWQLLSQNEWHIQKNTLVISTYNACTKTHDRNMLSLEVQAFRIVDAAATAACHSW